MSATPAQPGGLRQFLSRQLMTSYGGRLNASQGMRDVRQDQSDRAEGDEALAHAQRQAQADRTRTSGPGK